MFKNKFNINDNLISISFDDLITAVHCNEKIIIDKRGILKSILTKI